jgi:SAM-dependent methyltransferase
MKENNKGHWEHVYQTKSPNEVSWTQAVPQTSLDFIYALDLPKSARIIDIGGGDSNLADHLLEAGFVNITVLDISETALARAKARLGEKNQQIKWIVCDIAHFKPTETYHLWHDRAAFHFLTQDSLIAAYLDIARKAVDQYMFIGTFSENGPDKCSGLPVKQYSALQLKQVFARYFSPLNCITQNHTTPFGTTQNFLFCGFQKQ